MIPTTTPPDDQTPSGAKPQGELLRHVPRARSGMKILFLCHRVPYPPDKGDRIRAYHQIRMLARRHRVHLLTLADGPLPDLSPLDELCERVEVFPISRAAGYLRAARGVLSRRPLTLSFFESKELRGRVRELAAREGFDAVVAYSSSMAPYAELAGDVPKVLDMVDVDSAKWRQYSRFAALPMRPVYALEARRLQAYEAALSAAFDSVVFATGNEAELYRKLTPGARAAVIPNGIDLDFFRRLDLPRAPNPTLVFTGQMDYFANVDGITHFAKGVFPRLRRRFPDLELLVVGRSPAPSVRALGDLPGVQVTGAVGDVRPFLSRAWAFVAPLRITQGVQNKVLEAMATHLPTVCSDKVFAGISEGGFRHDRDLLVAGNDEEMERALTTLLQEPQTRERLAESARRRLTATYRWEPFLERLEDLILDGDRRQGGEEVPQPLAGGALSA